MMQTLLDHIFEGRCPDEIDGWDSRDVRCMACWRLDELPQILEALRDCLDSGRGLDDAIDRFANVLEPRLPSTPETSDGPNILHTPAGLR